MLRALLILILMAGTCCTTAKPLTDATVEPVVPDPWLCSVEIEAWYGLDPENPLRKSATLYMRRGEEPLTMIARGSGTIVANDGKDFTILTALHVIDGAHDVWVKRHWGDGTFWSMRMNWKMVHIEDDCAVFKVPSVGAPERLCVAPVARQMPEVGSKLYYAGNALGRGLKWMPDGRIASDVKRVVFGRPTWVGSYHIYPGCSGAGLWHDGKLVGIVTAGLSAMVKGMDDLPVNVAFADMAYFLGVDTIYPFFKYGKKGVVIPLPIEEPKIPEEGTREPEVVK